MTQSQWTQRYGYGGRIDIDPRPGGEYRAYASEATVGPDVSVVVVDGEISEALPGRRLALTWRMSGWSVVTCPAPVVVGAFVLSDLKSLLKTGSTLAG